MPKGVILPLKGLKTNPNDLSVAEGALVQATNLNINRDDVGESRRGFGIYGDAMSSSGTRAKQLMNYKERVLRHYATTLQYDDAGGTGTFTTISSDVAEVASGTKIKNVEANSNLYITSSKGIRKLDAIGSTLTNAGGLKALDGEASLVAGAGTTIPQNSQVAYRVVWGKTDANDNKVIGTPSERIVIANPIRDLVIQDFNDLLDKIDLAEPTASDALDDVTDYDTLAISLTSTALTLNGALKSLCSKLENDLGYTNISGTITANTLANPTVVTSAAHGLENGDSIVITGSNSTPTIDGTRIVTKIDANTFSVPVNVTVAGTAGSWTRTIGARYGRSGTDITTIPTGSANTAITLVTTTAHKLKVGDTIVISNSNSVPSIDDEYQITATPTTTSFSIVITQAVTAAGTSGTWTSGVAREYPTPTTDTQDDLLSQQAFFDEIVALLLAEPVAKIASAAQTAGDFQTSTQYKDVALEFTVPDNVTTDHFWQLYRSGPSISDESDPGDTLYLAHEEFYVSGSTITHTDQQPDSLLGAELYTNTNQEGISQANEPPPFAKDIELFKGSVFYANTKTVQRLNLAMLPIDDLVAGTSTLTFNNGVTSFTIKFDSTEDETASPNPKVKISTADTPAQQIDETARSLVRVVNRASANTFLNAYYLSGPNDVPGLMVFEALTLNAPAFYITANNTATGNTFSPAIPTSGQAVISTNEERANRVYFSKYQQPEAVPLLNYLDVGPRDKAILRIKALRDSLFIIKEDGIYRITGEIAPNWSVSLLDNSTKLIAPETVAVGNNLIYMLSDGGVATISDTGIGVVSRDIEDRLIPLQALSNLATEAFGVFYETERRYLLWVPTASSDTTATLCYTVNTFTNTWTTWDREQTCGAVGERDNKLYLGAGDTNYLERERKNFTSSDYADRSYSVTIGTHSGTTVTLDDTTNVGEGDLLVQTEYLNTYIFNRLLVKLDNDVFLPGGYFAAFEAATKEDLRTELNALIAQLVIDTAPPFAYASPSVSLDPSVILTDFNNLIDDLNDAANTGVNQKDYEQHIETSELQATVITVDTITTEVVLNVDLEFLEGAAATIYKAIPVTVEWAPYHGGNPAIMKHFRSTEVLFQDFPSVSVTLRAKSDLQQDFQDIDFTGLSGGQWGIAPWGQFGWGGESAPRALRTYIPSGKQRCRLLSLQMIHQNAYKKFLLSGISLDFEVMSERINR